MIGRAVNEIELRIPPAAGQDLVLQEIEVFGGEAVPVKVRYLLAEDLAGSGSKQIILVTEANEVIVFDHTGVELWRRKAPNMVCHVSCHDLLGDGQKYICLGIVGGELRILKPEGDLYRSVQLAFQYKKPQSLFGWMETLLGLAVWRRDESGRAALAVGSYATVIYLDPDFNILGHTFVDGSWIYNILSIPAGQPDAHNIWVRNGWNHGISVYGGLDSFEPSGSYADFGGIHQPMFRAIRRVIPFNNGATVAFDWIERPEGGRILAAAEFGVGLMDTQKMDWVWRQGGLPRITGCLPLWTGSPSIVTTAMDGFITRLEFNTGRPITSRWLGNPVVGLAHCAGSLVAATLEGVVQLNEDLQPLARSEIAAQAVVQTGPHSVAVLDRQSGLRQLKIE